MIVMVLGTLMYVIEGPTNGFTSITTPIYWPISTMTTVGFGDLLPAEHNSF
jgi:voltage-gated potassium channel